MKTIKAAISLLLLSSVTALADDLPSLKSAPVATSAPMWTGFYAGLNAGVLWEANNGAQLNSWQRLQTYHLDDIDANLAVGNRAILIDNVPVFMGGGQLGYNFQFTYSGLNFVSGIETDFQGVAASSSNGRYAGMGHHGSQERYPFWGSINKEIYYIGTGRGRIGYLLSPTTLIYGTAGVAYAGVNMTNDVGINELHGTLSAGQADHVPGLGNSNYSNVMVGWTAGGGLEWMFMQNWSAKVEYLYYDLGNAVTNPTTLIVSEIPFSNGPMEYEFGVTTSARSRFNGNILRAGVNYHFNFANVVPVVAKF